MEIIIMFQQCVPSPQLDGMVNDGLDNDCDGLFEEETCYNGKGEYMRCVGLHVDDNRVKVSHHLEKKWQSVAHVVRTSTCPVKTNL